MRLFVFNNALTISTRRGLIFHAVLMFVVLLAGLLGTDADAICGKARKTQAQKQEEQEVRDKPASQESDLKSITALLALKALEDTDFRGLGDCWQSCLLPMFGLFEDLLSGDVFISLGFQNSGVLAWRVNEVSTGLFALSTGNLCSEECQDRLQFLRLKTFSEPGALPDSDAPIQEEYQGIPYQTCSLTRQLN